MGNELLKALKTKEKRLETAIDKLKTEKVPLVEILNRKGLDIDLLKETQKAYKRVQWQYEEATFKLREVKREIAKIPVKKFPVEFIDENAEIKAIELDEDQMRELIRDVDQMGDAASISTKVKKDGTSVVQVLLGNIEDPSTPVFIKQVFKSAVSITNNLLKKGTVMDSKKIIAKLIKIAQNQQKIIEKLAQQNTDIVGLEGGKSPGPTAQPPAQSLPTGGQHVNPKYAVPALIQKDPHLSKVVLIDAYGKPAVAIEGNTVKVTMKPGQRTQANQSALEKVIFPLAASLPSGRLAVQMV